MVACVVFLMFCVVRCLMLFVVFQEVLSTLLSTALSDKYRNHFMLSVSVKKSLCHPFNFLDIFDFSNVNAYKSGQNNVFIFKPESPLEATVIKTGAKEKVR